MDIDLDYTKSAQDNAADYFERSKKAKRKAEGAERTVKTLQKRLEEIEGEEEERVKVRRVEKKEWYEKFRWFNTSNGMLAIGGRSAEQNEALYAKHFTDNDLFFHADVFGAPVVILQSGVSANREIKEEVAQFAACFSRAWEGGSSSADVYSLHRNQVSKSKQKGSLATGSFLLAGEREWYKATALELCVFKATTGEAAKAAVAPILTCLKLGIKEYVLLKPGNKKKSDAAKEIAKRLKYDDIDAIMQLLPAGDFSIR